jgi:predicted outer membrane repeat protein
MTRTGLHGVGRGAGAPASPAKRVTRWAATAAALATTVGAGAAFATPALAAPVTTFPVACSASALATAINLAPSDAILSLKTGCTYNLTAALPTITRNLTIQGNRDTITRSNNAQFTAITVNGAQLNINQLRITDFNGNGNNPGALRNVGGTVMVTSTTFADNDGGNGGAVQNDQNGSFTATSSTFSFNDADNDGGALYNRGGSEAWFNTTTFFDNEAPDGGAIYIATGHVTTNGTSTATSASTVFNSNEADGVGGFGGAIDNHGGVLTTNYTNFTNNESTNTSGDGGAVNNDGGTSTLTNTGFSGNFAADDGGAIYTSKSLNLVSVNIAGNRAGDDGGGIFVENGNTSLNKTIVSGNFAGDLGGGIRRAGGSVSLTNFSLVKVNFPTNCSGTVC